MPALAGNHRLVDKAYAIAVVTNGRGGMPRFADILTPAQIAAVLTYVRGHFNTFAEPVTAAEAEKFASGSVSPLDCHTCGH